MVNRTHNSPGVYTETTDIEYIQLQDGRKIVKRTLGARTDAGSEGGYAPTPKPVPVDIWEIGMYLPAILA